MRGLTISMLMIPTILSAASVAAVVPKTANEKDVFLTPGEKVAPFEAVGVDGILRRVEFDRKQVTILMFFGSGCPACHRMIPEWNRAFTRRASNLDVIGVIVDTPPPKFFQIVPISFPVVRSPGRDFLERFKVARIPITLRIASGGRVEDIGVGALDGIRLGQIFRP
jgi:thiol-disulfide isomerase/thioredoxin